jgi:hypothetical protein
MTEARTLTQKTFQRRASTRALAACLFAALLVAAAATRAQTNNSSEDVMDAARTPAGELSLVRRRGADETVTIVIKLGDRVVAEKEASERGDAYRHASLLGLYPQDAPRYALVRLSTDSLVCASMFTVVDLSAEGAAKATRDFGNCGDAPRVAYRGGSLTVTFPAGPRKRDPGTHYVGPGQVWSYTGGRLRRISGR